MGGEEEEDRSFPSSFLDLRKARDGLNSRMFRHQIQRKQEFAEAAPSISPFLWRIAVCLSAFTREGASAY